MPDALVIPVEVRGWWGSQARVRRRAVAGTVFHEVGYRRRTGGFCLVGRAVGLEVAVEKARQRLHLHSVTAEGPRPTPAPKKAREERHDGLVVIHKNMPLRLAIKEAKRQGWGIREIKGTDELLFQAPGREKRIKIKGTRRDTPQLLVAALRQGAAGCDPVRAG